MTNLRSAAGAGELDEVAEARAAVAVGLWTSATRCVLTYVMVPAFGVLGVVLGPVGLLLQTLGAVTSVSGAVRLRRVGWRAWPAYAVVAAAVTATAVLGWVRTLAGAR